MHTPAVQRTLHELAADTLGCVDLHTSLVTEGAYALRDEGAGTWMAVVSGCAETEAIRVANELASLEEPPVRIVVVMAAGARAARLRARADLDVFETPELAYNATRHMDAPVTSKLNEHERARLLDTLQLDDASLLPGCVKGH